MSASGDAVTPPPAEPAPAPAEPAPPPAEPAEQHKPMDLMQLVTSIGSPIALATALLFYFGWVRSEEQAREFGADASVFDMSTQDYVLRSVNILFFPVILLLLLAMLALRVDRSLRAGSRTSRRLAPLGRALRYSWALFLGLGVVLLATTGAFGLVTLPLWVGLAIVGPVYGTVLRRRATGDPTRFSRVTVALLASLLTVTLFWQTERLASLGGEAIAEDIKQNMDDRLERVDLFSAKDLNLDGPGVTRTTRSGEDVAFAYHYAGLYLLQRSGGKYFLLTDGWEDGEGRLVVVLDSDDVRLEFGS